MWNIKKKTYTHTKNVRNTNNNNKLDNNNNKNKNPVREIYSDYYRYFSHIKLKDISIPVIEKSNKNKSQKDRRLDDLSALEVNLSIVQWNQDSLSEKEKITHIQLNCLK